MGKKLLSVLLTPVIISSVLSTNAYGHTSKPNLTSKLFEEKYYLDTLLDRRGRARETYYQKAREHYENQDFDKAIEEYKKALTLYPTPLEEESIYFSLGINYGMKEEFEKSIWHFKRAISLNPNSPITYLNLGVSYTSMYEKLRKPDEIQYLIKALRSFIIYDYLKKDKKDNKVSRDLKEIYRYLKKEIGIGITDEFKEKTLEIFKKEPRFLFFE